MNDRADRVAGALAERELDALLITKIENVRWLSGFTGTSAACIVGADQRVFLTDFRYVEQAADQVHGFDIRKTTRDPLAEVGSLLSGRVGFEDAWLSVRAHRLVTESTSAELVGATGILESLRATKDEGEIAAMRAAAQLTDQVYAELAESGFGDRTEKRVAADIELRLLELGAERLSFPSIVASGAHGALPHAAPRDVPVERDTFVVLDVGCVVDGYCSDCTRTFANGRVDEQEREVYELVSRAQLAALDAVQPGAVCREVDAVARDLIAGAGYGDNFGHGLGHGVGIEIHEEPRLAQRAEGELALGTTVTVEPGVYLSGGFGVRIEDLVVARDGGAERLTEFTKDLVELG